MRGFGFLKPADMDAVRVQAGLAPPLADEAQAREDARLVALAMRARAREQQRVAFWSPWGIVLGVSALGLAVMAFSSGRGR